MIYDVDRDALSSVESWFEYLRYVKNLSENTYLSYKNDFTLFVKFLHVFEGYKITLSHLLLIDQRTIRSWFAYRCNQEISHRSNARALSAIKNFFRYMVKKGYKVNEEIFSISSRFKSNLLPKYLSNEELDDLLHAIRTLRKGWLADRDTALCYLLYATGLRISEALSLVVKELDSDVITVRTKGGKKRVCKLLPEVKTFIREYMKSAPFDFNQQDFIFRGNCGGQLSRKAVASFFIALKKKANLPTKVKAHALRHTFAVHLFKEGVGIRSLQELLGHASLSSTDIYTKLDHETLIKEYNKISLRDDDE